MRHANAFLAAVNVASYSELKWLPTALLAELVCTQVAQGVALSPATLAKMRDLNALEVR